MLDVFNIDTHEAKIDLVPAGRDQILIRGLLLQSSIGIFQHEYENKQDIEIDLIIDISAQSEVRGYDKSNILRYDHIVEDITKLVSDFHFELVETLAEAIAQICFLYEAIESVDIVVTKLEAIEAAKSVGVRLKRRKVD